LTADERLSRAWWIVPAVWAVAVLVLLAESARSADDQGMWDLLSAIQFLVYLAWLRLAWRASRSIVDPWRLIAQAALVAGLALSAMV
jgi:hypothetical protein